MRLVEVCDFENRPKLGLELKDEIDSVEGLWQKVKAYKAKHPEWEAPKSQLVTLAVDGKPCCIRMEDIKHPPYVLWLSEREFAEYTERDRKRVQAWRDLQDLRT